LTNFYHGYQVGRENNTIAYAAQQYVWSNNIVGNILGTEGYHTRYAVTNVSTYNSYFSLAIFRFGEASAGDAENDASGFVGYDFVAFPSTLIHGNYDTINDSITWDSNIADHTIPNSFYYSSKPSWFGQCPWPPFNPTNTSAAATSPTNIPAGYRYFYGQDPPENGNSLGNTRINAGKFRILR